MFDRAGPRTLSEYARHYTLLRDVKAETVRQYQICAQLFERWAAQPILLEELDERSVSEFLRSYAASGVSPSTVRSKKVGILALWRAAADEGLCEPPTRRVRSVRVPYKPPTAWSLEEVEQLLAACRGLKRWHRCGLRRSVWWDLAIRVAWDSGLRWGDQMRLPINVVRPDGTAAITQSKTGRPVVFRLSPTTMEVLRSTLTDCPRSIVTPWPASHETFGDQMERLIVAAGVRHGTWKWLRRGSSTDCEVQAAGSAGPHLGHTPGSRIAEISYVDPAILGRRGVVPRQLRFQFPAG